jgi:hypothetical protein
LNKVDTDSDNDGISDADEAYMNTDGSHSGFSLDAATKNCALQAYWDAQNCGCSVNDQHAEDWCQSGTGQQSGAFFQDYTTVGPICKDEVNVDTSVCATGKAKLLTFRVIEDYSDKIARSFWIDSCRYYFHAQVSVTSFFFCCFCFVLCLVFIILTVFFFAFLLGIIISTAAKSRTTIPTWMLTEFPIIWTPTSPAGHLTPTAKSAATSMAKPTPASVPTRLHHASAPSAMPATLSLRTESARPATTATATCAPPPTCARRAMPGTL